MLAASEPLITHDSPTSSTRRTWKPSGDAHLIFHWVKMEGKSQGWVAGAMNISQSTVSRMIQRYERWQAHAKEREDGRLDPAERLRAQRWLTFERNELILTSCLRIANELEGFIDASKSTLSHPARHPSQESEVRTEHFRVDRTGMTARFLRLAFKINMEQLKLAELAQPPLASPLSDEELAHEERQAAADEAELATARRRSEEQVSAELAEDRNEQQSDGGTAGKREKERERQRDAAATGDAEASLSLLPSVSPSLTPGAAQADSTEPTAAHSPTHNSPAPLHKVHKLHSENGSQIAASPGQPCCCGLEIETTKNSIDLCIIECDQPAWPSDEASSMANAPLAATQSL